MGKRLGLFLLGWALVVAGALFAHLVQTAGDVSVRDVRYTGDDGVTFSALLYEPAAATPQHPAPAVLVSHGFINTREMQSPFAIELARRGFVVLAMDMSGHGYSGGALGEQGFGGPAALRFLLSQPNVDKANIGLEGHSLGGAPIAAAAIAYPSGYKAMVLEGSTTGVLGQPGEGSTSFPRNLAVVFGQYDEFAPLMWQVAKGSDVGRSRRLMTIFGAQTPVIPGRVYGDIAAGTARILYNPPVDHPGEHFSTAGVGAAVDWFQRTLSGASPRPPAEQIWFGKEIGTLIAFVGCIVLILGTFQLAISTRVFGALRAQPEPAAVRRGPRWQLGFVVTAALPAITFYPLMKVAPAVFLAPFAATGTLPFALATFSEQITNRLAIWAIGTGLIGLLLATLLRSGRTRFPHRWSDAAAVALVSVGMGYLALALVDAVFKVDFRFWVLGLKPLDERHFAYFVLYLPFFALFALAALKGICMGLPVRGEREWTAVLVGGGAMALGFAVMLAAQYLHMAATGLLITPDDPLNTIIAFQFVPILFVIGVISAFTYRRTGDYAPGAFVCALFVTWYVVCGTAVFPASTTPFAPPKRPPATQRAPSAAPAPPSSARPAG